MERFKGNGVKGMRARRKEEEAGDRNDSREWRQGMGGGNQN